MRYDRNWSIEKTAAVAERFQFHCEKAKTDNPIVSQLALQMCDIEL